MKKLLAILLAAMMLLSLTACGKNSNEKAIVGTWQLVDTELETEYGLGIEFEKDGTLQNSINKAGKNLMGGTNIDP